MMKQSYTWHMASGPGGIWEEFGGQTTSEATNGETLWIKGLSEAHMLGRLQLL